MRLKTQLTIALRRAASLHARSEWTARLDPAAYTCERDRSNGAPTWIATGPAGQVFRFIAQGRDIICESSSGAIYPLYRMADSHLCPCPVQGPCKHLQALAAVCAAAKVERTSTLRAEAEEMNEERIAA